MFNKDYKVTIHLFNDVVITVDVDYYDISHIKQELNTNCEYINIENYMIPKSNIACIKYENIKEEK